MSTAPSTAARRHDQLDLDSILHRLVQYAQRTATPYELVNPFAASSVCLRLDRGRIVVQLTEPYFLVDNCFVTEAQLIAEVRAVGHLYLAADMVASILARGSGRLEVSP